mmetsp:Transcript_4172/g.9788  ORF Transcript_4172/g.9788 Transcript_4172/m.9788 type:complete len:181 (-) Transcript_4172:510-1052(-)
MESGSIILAFGPTVAAGLLLIDAPHLIIIVVSSIFCFLSSQLLAALIWLAFMPLTNSRVFYVTMYVFVLEGFRYGFFVLYKLSEDNFVVKIPHGTVYPLRDLSSSIVAGYGFGLARVYTFHRMILRHSLDKATLYPSQCERVSSFNLIACSALCTQVVHAILMPIAFDGCYVHDADLFCK